MECTLGDMDFGRSIARKGTPHNSTVPYHTIPYLPRSAAVILFCTIECRYYIIVGLTVSRGNHKGRLGLCLLTKLIWSRD